MRNSLKNIAHMVREIAYKGNLPEELKPYHTYLLDAGHSIMCILEGHLDKAQKSGMDDYEIPVPVKYVLEKGYKIVDGYVLVDAEYDNSLGLMVDEEYTEI